MVWEEPRTRYPDLVPRIGSWRQVPGTTRDSFTTRRVWYLEGLGYEQRSNTAPWSLLFPDWTNDSSVEGVASRSGHNREMTE
jgi:hypothetical protein